MENNEEKDLSVDESIDVTENVVDVAEQQGEVEKTYTQQDIDDMKAKWESGFQKKLDKAISRKMRDVEEENFKKDQLINVLKEQTKSESIDSLLDISEEQYGVKIQRNKNNSRDDVILGQHDAKEVIDEEDMEYAAKELERLANLKRNVREDEAYKTLSQYIETRASEEKRKKEILENGLDEEMVNSQEFIDFQSKFSNSTPLSDVVDMYEKINGIQKEKPFSAGSLKDTKVKEINEYFTLDEFNALTAKDLDDPKIYEKAMKSMHQFYKK